MALETLFVAIDAKSSNVIGNKSFVICDSVFEALDFKVEAEDSSQRKSPSINAYGVSHHYLEHLDGAEPATFHERSVFEPNMSVNDTS